MKTHTLHSSSQHSLSLLFLHPCFPRFESLGHLVVPAPSPKSCQFKCLRVTPLPSFPSFFCFISAIVQILLLTLSVVLLSRPPQSAFLMLALFRNHRVLFCPVACLSLSVILCSAGSCLGSHPNHLCINLTQIMEGVCSSWQLGVPHVSTSVREGSLVCSQHKGPNPLAHANQQNENPEFWEKKYPEEQNLN